MNGGFKERAARNGTPTYVYDANGNLTQDKNKGLTITYNYLNLPQTITFDGTQGNAGGTIDFTYDATGKKWRKTVTPTRQCGQVRDYIDGVEYTSTLCGLILSSPTPDLIHFSDGYVQRDPSTDGNYSWLGWVYKYALTDHLGNTRVVFSDKNDDGVVGLTDIEQINNYYPFGLNMDGPWNGASGQYKFQYNNKEWNSDLGLNLNDYGARFYDPTIGRWNSVDLMSEKMRRYSPYDYAYDNPIRFIDDNGNEPADPGPAWVRTAQFALKHPIAAHRIGDVSKGATNISTDAARFSTRSASIESKSSVLDEPKEQGNQGSQVNAFRHVLWQATITNEFGSDIANQIGRAHEENATAIDDKSSTQLSNTTFKSLSEADESIDLANI